MTVFVNEHRCEFSKRNISMLREYSVGISANTRVRMTEGSLFPQFLRVCSCVILCVCHNRFILHPPSFCIEDTVEIVSFTKEATKI